jgi:hypothetical protein
VAFDLEKPTAPEIKPKTLLLLTWGCAILLTGSLLISLRQRNRMATALICTALLVPAMWFRGMYQLYTFQGLIYPLTLAGMAILARATIRSQEGTTSSPSPKLSLVRRGYHWCQENQVKLLALLLVAMIGLRIPQIRASVNRYVLSKQHDRIIHRLSEANELRQLIGSEQVDVALGHWADNHFVWAELAVPGVQVRFRSPAWEVSVGAYAGPNPQYDLFAPKSRFTLVERGAWSSPGTERWAGLRLKLLEDQAATSIVGVTRSSGVGWDENWCPSFWIGSSTATILVNNGTGQPQTVSLRGDTQIGPVKPNQDQCVLSYCLGTSTGRLFLAKKDKASIPLRLNPGLNKIELTIEEKGDPSTKPGIPVQWLELKDLRIEPVESLDSGKKTQSPHEVGSQ